MSKTVVTVNGVAWTESSHRGEKPCEICKTPTRGRIERKPFCRDCGMKQIMQPLQSVKEMIRGLFQ
jgi:hypothetical protein